MSLPKQEFLDRVVSHYLPKGFRRVRLGGIYATNQRKKLAHAKNTLAAEREPPGFTSKADTTTTKTLKTKTRLKPNSVVTAKVKRRFGCAVKSVPINRRCCWSVTYRAARRCRASLTSCCWQCFSKGNLPSHPRIVQPACLGVLDKWRPTSARRSSSTNRSPATLQVPSPPYQAPW